MNYFRIALAAAAGYLLGSVSIAVLFSKHIHKNDVRLAGSKNAGAANVARTYGMRSGLAVLGGDILKTILAMLTGKLLAGTCGLTLSGIFCLTGHCWPLFFRFKGGKGVAAGAAFALMLDWRLLIILLSVFIIIYSFTKIISAGSLAAAAAFPAVWIYLSGFSVSALLTGVSVTAIVFIRHAENISRLIRGEETKFSVRSRTETQTQHQNKKDK